VVRDDDPVTTGQTGAAPWGRITVLFQVALFAIPATVAWRSSLNSTAYVPLVGLAAGLLAGVLLLVARTSRRAGVHIVLGVLVAAVVEVALTLLLIFAYSGANPEWDLS
jgi:ABC-type amino acid transport system permease subunit